MAPYFECAILLVILPTRKTHCTKEECYYIQQRSEIIIQSVKIKIVYVVI